MVASHLPRLPEVLRAPTAALLLCPLLLAGLLAACGGSESTGGDGLPEVRGAYGAKPKVTVDEPTASRARARSTDVLVEGDGPKVEKGDLLVADYLGKVYETARSSTTPTTAGSPGRVPLKSAPAGSSPAG